MPSEVAASAWFDDPTYATGVLLESTYAIVSQGQIVSLLWRPPDDGSDDD